MFDKRINYSKGIIDPKIVDLVIQNFDSDKFDYIANFQVTEENGSLVYRSTYPSGTEVEIMSLETLEKTWNEATTLDEKEHVTPYVYLNPDKFKIKFLI